MRSLVKISTPDREYYYDVRSRFYDGTLFLHLPHMIINVSDDLILFLSEQTLWLTDLFGNEILGHTTWKRKFIKNDLWSADCFRYNGRPFVVFKQALHRDRKFRDDHRFILYDLSRIRHIYLPSTFCYYANHGTFLVINHVNHRDLFAVIDMVSWKYVLFTVYFGLYNIYEVNAVRYMAPWLYMYCDFRSLGTTAAGILVCNLETGSIMHVLYPRVSLGAYAGFFHNRYMLFWNHLFEYHDMFCFDILNPAQYYRIRFTAAYGKKLLDAYRQVFQVSYAPSLAVISESSDKGNISFYHQLRSQRGYVFWMHNGHLYTASRVSSRPDCTRDQYLDIRLNTKPRTRMSLADVETDTGEDCPARLVLIDSGSLSKFSWKKI